MSDKEKEELKQTYKAFEGPAFKELLKLMFLNWNPMPDVAYARKVGWPVNEDGTIDTPGMGRVPSRELCEEKEIEKLYETSDLIHLHKLEDPRPCQHRHRASNGWADVTNCEMGHSMVETEAEREKVDAHNLALQQQAYAMAERQDYCLDCGAPLDRIGHDSAKLRVSDCGLRYWEV